MYMYILYIMPGQCTFTSYILCQSNHSIPFSLFMVADNGSTAARVRSSEGNKWGTDRERICLYMLTNLMMFHKAIFSFQVKECRFISKDITSMFRHKGNGNEKCCTSWFCEIRAALGQHLRVEQLAFVELNDRGATIRTTLDARVNQRTFWKCNSTQCVLSF